MRDTDRGVRGVNGLAAGSRGPVDVDLEIVLVDFELFGLVHFRQHQNAGSRGVDAPLRLGDGNALHAVHAALELQPRVDALGGIVRIALDGHLNVLVAAKVRFVRGNHFRLQPRVSA